MFNVSSLFILDSSPDRRPRRSAWLARAAFISLVSTALAAGCGDDDDDDDESGGAGRGNAGAPTSGSSTAGSPSGGTNAEGGAPAGTAGHDGTAGQGGADADHPAFATEGDRRIPYTPRNDLEFAEFFIAHHEMAIEMATHVTERGSNAEVQAMAEQLIETQTAEVMALEAIRDQLGGNAAPPPADPHAEAEMESMASASGAMLDRMFLLEMIPHHAAGLPSAHRAQPFLDNPELQQLAEDIVQAQATEIGEMHMLLRELGATGAGEDMAPDDPNRADFGLVGDRRVPLTPEDDVTFIDFFVPHHEMAIQMAEHVVAHGESADVKAMAEMMIQAQTAEVELMQAKREELEGSPSSPPMPEDPHAMTEMEQMMALSGTELDRMFLQEMIVHHSSALPTSHRAKPHVSDMDLQALADTMFDAQATEIGEMQRMLE
jgi:uncharacterized protein (DUF305 family)